MNDGQIAYEAAFLQADFARGYALPWDRLPADARAVWARVEGAVRASRAEAAPAPQGDNAALIERLRRQSGSSHTCLGCDDEIKAEAADAIEALVRGNAAMNAMCDSYADENQRLHDRAEKAERLAAALEAAKKESRK